MGHAQVRRVYEESLLLALQFGTVDYDDKAGSWVRIPYFPLPVGWDRGTTGVLFELPHGYPHVPPDGFYIDRFLRTRYGRQIGHYFENRGRFNRYADHGWGWFCIHLESGAWHPAAEVARGDNLLKLAALIRAILTRAVSARGLP